MAKIVCLLLSLLIWQMPAAAQDMRLDYVKKRQQQEAALRQAEAAARQAEAEEAQRRQAMLADKGALTRTIEELETNNRLLKARVAGADERLRQLKDEGRKLRTAYDDISGVVKEIIGFARNNARDLAELFRQSPQSALIENRLDLVDDLAQGRRFAAMADVRQLVDLLAQEIELSGQVRRVQGRVIDRAGNTAPADLLLAGNLTVAYKTPSETGFGLYSDNSNQIFALSSRPSWATARRIKKYMAGETVAMDMDISGGAALRQMTHRLSLMAQIPGGGPIVWPILLIFLLGGGIVVERTRYLRQRNCDVEGFMARVGDCLRQEDWTGCRDLCGREKNKSVPRVILTALDYREMSREDMENALQEAILNEVPRLERFLSTLGMLAAIAPLLGLLGTVTGMINTFHVITYYGTGDPRMMSGGISEALVTTMLGLGVAIPLMLAHTLLSRRVETIIGQMEEKAVSFVNQVFKTRER